MRTYLGLVVIAFAAVGCTDDAVDDGLTTATTAQAVAILCPLETGCTHTNGGGVTTEELGGAGIGPNDFEILRFVNLAGGGVTIQGRQVDPATQQYVLKSTDGQIDAYYAGVGRGVVSINEVANHPTEPEISLSGFAGFPNGIRSFVGDEILDVYLVILIDGLPYTLSFWSPRTEINPAGSAHVNVHTFFMRWNPQKNFSSPNTQPYCYRALTADPANPNQHLQPLQHETDPVVFQQGIGVNPLTATMVVNNSYTTMSCFHGAMATVAWWGYPYRGSSTQTNRFEAAMHMKRASYCGDKSFYTRSGTQILIKDNVTPTPIQNDSLSTANFEAAWGTTSQGIRAVCVNMAKRRRPGVFFPPQTGADWDGKCNNVALPDCPGGVAPLSISGLGVNGLVLIADEKKPSP